MLVYSLEGIDYLGVSGDRADALEVKVRVHKANHASLY